MIRQAVSWADLSIGLTFDTSGRTITESDIVTFAGSTADFSPMHIDHEFARASQFGGVIAHGLLGLSIAHGLMFGGGLLGQNAIAFLGLSDWNFRAPIAPGDTIHVEFEVTDLRRRSSVPEQGIVTFAVRVLNQKGNVVQEGRKALLMQAPVGE